MNFLASCERPPGETATMCQRCLAQVEEASTFEEFVELDAALLAGTVTRSESDKLAAVLRDCA